jgi:hypothetical protein
VCDGKSSGIYAHKNVVMGISSPASHLVTHSASARSCEPVSIQAGSLDSTVFCDRKIYSGQVYVTELPAEKSADALEAVCIDDAVINNVSIAEAADDAISVSMVAQPAAAASGENFDVNSKVSSETKTVGSPEVVNLNVVITSEPTVAQDLENVSVNVSLMTEEAGAESPENVDINVAVGIDGKNDDSTEKVAVTIQVGMTFE